MAVKYQLSVALPNRPNELGNIMSALGRQQVNIDALTVTHLVDHLVLRIVPADVVRAKRILAALRLHVRETLVVIAPVPNEPGALGTAASCLSEEGIEIDYLYGSALQNGDEAVCVFAVSDPHRADALLAAEDDLQGTEYVTFERLAAFSS